MSRSVVGFSRSRVARPDSSPCRAHTVRPIAGGRPACFSRSISKLDFPCSVRSLTQCALFLRPGWRRVSAEKRPAFQFYPKDFLSDVRVMHMSNTERGIYITLLCICWLEETIPGDIATLSKLARARPDRFTKMWSASLQKCFCMTDDGNYRHKRLDEERAKQGVFRQIQRKKGEASGLARRTAVQFGSRSVEPNTNSPISDLLSSSSYVQEESRELLPHSRPAFLIFPVTGTKGHEWPLTETLVLKWSTSYPALDIRAESRKALAWIEANPRQKKTFGGMPAFMVRWFNRATDRGGRGPESVSPAGKLTTRLAMAHHNIQREGNR